jgi:hypothetical protein
MNSTTIILLAIVILISVAGLVIWYLRLAARRLAWSEVASRANLAFDPGNLWGTGSKVSGIYRGHELVLDTFSTYTGKSRTEYTRVTLTTSNPSGMQLEIFKEGLLGKLGKTLGMKDIQVGDAEIDQNFIIRGQPENQVARLFTAIGLRQRLLETRSLNIKLAGNRLNYQRRGIENDETTLINIFDLLAEMADQIEHYI